MNENIPENHAIMLKKIGDIASVMNGFAFKSDEYKSEGLRLIRITNVQKGTIVESTPKFIDASRYKEFFGYLLRGGDILVSLTGNVGRVGILSKDFEPAVLNQRVGCIRARTELVDLKYLFHVLNSDKFENEAIKNSKGIAQLNLSAKWVEDYKIYLPAIADQRQIATVLDKVDALRQKRKESIKLLDDFLKATFLDMFGDPQENPKHFPLVQLQELYIDPKNGTKCGPFGSALKKEEIVDEGIPVWNMDNISLAGRFIAPFRMWITPEKYDALRSYSVLNGDVIISRAGTVGKMCVAKNKTESIISTNLIRVRFGQKLLPIFFVSLMNYCKGSVGRLKTGADGTFTHMSTGVLDNLTFPYPPLDLQKKFANIVEKVELQKQTIIRSQDEINNLFNALMQKYFG